MKSHLNGEVVGGVAGLSRPVHNITLVNVSKARSTSKCAHLDGEVVGRVAGLHGARRQEQLAVGPPIVQRHLLSPAATLHKRTFSEDLMA